MKESAPYGTWDSSVTAEFVSGKDRVLMPYLQVDGTDLYLIESRPDEGGRQVLMRRDQNGTVASVIPDTFSVRTSYLEYSGSSFVVSGGNIFFVNAKDQQIYRSRADEQPVQITQDPKSRFADLSIDQRRNRLLALRELESTPEPKNTICSIQLETGEIRDLVGGCDFYLSPRLNEREDQLLWISWNHPNMAWNGTELWVGDVAENGSVMNAKKIIGDSSHGVCQPQWIRENEIAFVAELDNWFNLYCFRQDIISNLYPVEGEFAFPDWTPGQKRYGVCGNTICASFQSKGSTKFIFINEQEKRELPHKFPTIIFVEPSGEGFFAVVSHAHKPPSIVHLNLQGQLVEIYSSYRLQLSAGEISAPCPIEFVTDDHTIGHAWFYEPTNEKFAGLPGEKPPLIVICHGGPTAMSAGDFKKGIQFWTNRGYAVVDVNYGGSTGYGRNYRERLREKWGVVDVRDCAAVVKHLVQRELIDTKRVAIRGSSAGGYTTLAALTFSTGTFSVGASYYGVSDLELLAKETHKLESRYLEQLIGPYPASIKVYQERSPLNHVDRLNCPIIFFQGTEDKIVPPNQSQLMHESLQKKKIYSEYHLYPEEGHGFRRGENIQHSLKAEHRFYAKFFGFHVSANDRI